MPYFLLICIDILLFIALLLISMRILKAVVSSANISIFDASYKTLYETDVKKNFLLTIIMAFLAVPTFFSFIYYYIYTYCNSNLITNAYYASYPNQFVWGATSLCLSFSFLLPIFTFFARLHFGNKFLSFVRYALLGYEVEYGQNKHYSDNSITAKKSHLATKLHSLKRAVYILLIFGIAIVLIQKTSLCSTANFFTDASITIGFRQYHYSDIDEIYYIEKYIAPTGNVDYDPYIAIVFNDGYIWTDRNVKSLDDQSIKKLVQLSDIDIKYADTLTDK